MQPMSKWVFATKSEATCTKDSIVPPQVIPPEPGHIGWIAPLSICVLLFIGNGGYGTLIWVVMAELLPPR